MLSFDETPAPRERIVWHNFCLAAGRERAHDLSRLSAEQCRIVTVQMNADSWGTDREVQSLTDQVLRQIRLEPQLGSEQAPGNCRCTPSEY